MNSEYDLLNGRLKVGENLELNYMNYREANHTQLAANEPPIIPVYTETGGWGGASLDVGMDDYRNPVKDLILGKDNVNKFLKVIGNTYADLMIIKGLNLRTSFGVDFVVHIIVQSIKNGVKQTVRAVMKSSTMSATIRLISWNTSGPTRSTITGNSENTR